MTRPDTTGPAVGADGPVPVPENETPIAGSLAGHTAKGVAWVAGGRLLSQLVQFASTIVLARLLLPADYGLTAVVWVFMGFAYLLADLGLGAALVQRRVLTEVAASTAFAINATVGLVLTLLLSGLSQPLASLYGHPNVAALLALASLNFTLSVSMVPVAMLERQLRFRAIAVVDIMANVTGLGVTIACAASGLGAYSLVLGPIASTIVTSAATFALAGWLPSARPTRAAAGELWGFGKHLTGFNLVNYWARNADSLLLGRFATPVNLGFYNRAYNLMMMPVAQVGGVIGRVLLPVLSRVREEPARLNRAYLRVVRAACVIFFPVLYGMAAVATNFVEVAFGARWHGMVTLLILLAIAGAPQVPVATSGSLCQATGRPELMLTWGSLGSLLNIVAIVCGLPWGVEGVAIAILLRTYLLLPLAFMPAVRATSLRMRDIAGAIILPFAAASAMGVAVAGLGLLADGHVDPAPTLAAQVVAGIAVYVGIMLMVGRDGLHDAFILVLRRRGPESAVSALA